MAMILDAFVSPFAERLSTLMEEEVIILLGVRSELKKLDEKIGTIKDVLEAAEKAAFHDTILRRWVNKLKDVMYDADDIIDECRGLILEPPASTSSVCYHFPLSFCHKRLVFRHKIGRKIRSINFRLEEINKERSDFQLTPTVRGDRLIDDSRQTSPLVEPDIVGSRIEEDTTSLVMLLTGEYSRANLVVAIAGMGGIGKTTFAQKIYADERIKANFQETIWVCVSKDFSYTNILKEIISCVGGNLGGVESRGQLEPMVKTALDGKKFFLVLDDVWDVSVWEDLLRIPLNGGAVGSRILVTTRDEGIARQMKVVHIHRVNLLPLEDGWSLLRKKVVMKGEEGELEELKDIGMQIVEKCDGLPLAIKTIGGVLSRKNRSPREWNEVLQSQLWSSTGLPEGISGALLLSYEDLPSHLKQCFLYCSLFPEDYLYRMGFLISIWIAEGFVKADGSLEMEVLGERYYRELLQRSLLQSNPSSYREMSCKIHDLLRSLGQFLARDECLVVGDVQRIEDFSTSIKVRRLSLLGNEVATIPDVIKKQSSLRTLLVSGNPLGGEGLYDLFEKLKCLRVLDLSNTGINNVPDSVGSLIHLRYLDLSRTKIKEIAETIGYLINLQVLNLFNCEYLQSLPNGIANLSNLRCLFLSRTPISGIPVGIGRLRNLRKLVGFVVGSNGKGRGDEESHIDWCSLHEIRPLSQLRILSMDNLERALTRNKAGGAILENMHHLDYLHLKCTLHGTDGQPYPYTEEEIQSIKEVFDELCPPSCLETLTIMGFFGCDLPNWMMMMPSSSSSRFRDMSPLSNLVRLDLVDCNLCAKLPPLGQLPQLDYLRIKGAHAVITIGPEFLGGISGDDAGGGGRIVGTHSSFNPFPKLRKLIFVDMPNWEEWLCGDVVEDQMIILPCLDSLHLDKCPKLRSLSMGILHFATSLTRLVIKYADSLRAIEGLLLVKDLRLRYSPLMERLSNLPALEKLYVTKCQALKDVENLDALQLLELGDTEMESLPEWSILQEVHHITASRAAATTTTAGLQKLKIWCKADLLCKISLMDDGPEWHKIRHIPYVNAYTPDESLYISYTKDPFSFTTNINNAIAVDSKQDSPN